MLDLASAAIVWFLLDRWSKAIAERIRHQTWLGCLHCTCVSSQKSRYRSHAARCILVAVWCCSLASAWVLHTSGRWFQDPVTLVGLGCALGGAAANLADILQRQSVVDFIDLGWWPIFNLADVGIVGGLALALWHQ